MSTITDRLGSRAMTEATDLPSDELSIADLRPGQSAVVSRICNDAGASAARRYFDLGFTPGAVILAVRRAPLGGPVVLRVAGYDIALRRGQASCIKVTLV